jgi:hypothetical protein
MMKFVTIIYSFSRYEKSNASDYNEINATIVLINLPIVEFIANINEI